MKRKLCVIVVAFAVIIAATFAGCAKKLVVNTDGDGVTQSVIIRADDGVLGLTETTTLADYLKALSAKGKLELDYTEGQYGMFINSVNGTENKSTSLTSGYSWMVYTDLTEYGGVIYSSADYGTFDSEGTTLNSASYGADGLPMVKGFIYALVYAEWSY